MTVSSSQHDAIVISDRLQKRLESLNVTLLLLSVNGRAEPQGSCQWLDRLLIQSPQFIGYIRKNWLILNEQHGQVIEVWPGLWLLPLAAYNRRRTNTDNVSGDLHAIMIVGSQITQSEQLRHACDVGHMDYQAALARINNAQLVNSQEITRLASTLNWMYEDSGEIDRRLSEIHAMSRELAES